MKSISIYSRIFLLFIGIFELLLSLYLLITADNCTMLTCNLFGESTKTLAYILLFSSILILMFHSFDNIPKGLKILFMVIAATPLVLLFIPLFAIQEYTKAIVLLNMTLGLLITPFLPQNPSAKKMFSIMSFFFPLYLLSTAPFFSLIGMRINQPMYHVFTIAMIVGSIYFLYRILAKNGLDGCKANIIILLAFFTPLLEGIRTNSIIEILFSVLSCLFILGYSLLNSLFCPPNDSESQTPYKHFIVQLERVFWFVDFLTILTVLYTPETFLKTPSRLIYILIGIVSIFAIFFIHFLPSKFYQKKTLFPSLIVFNIMAFLIITATGGFESPLIVILGLFLIIAAIQTEPRWVLFLSSLDIGFFVGLLVMVNFNQNFIYWFCFNSVLFGFIAFFINKILELKIHD